MFTTLCFLRTPFWQFLGASQHLSGFSPRFTRSTKRQKSWCSLSDELVTQAIKEFAEFLEDSTLKSSVRLLIVISLALNKRLSFSDLLKLTGIGKGSLSNHLERLSARGYLRTRVVLTLNGPRTIAEITQKGMQIYQKYLKLMEKIRSLKENPSQGAP
ncbi:hypothetical protein B9Q02_09295 [Candidatus Marsarchaeota G1 archaeon BE_D]|uniref:Winged helix DNA-binding domain-containing protein n=1 Tax=Candidatus Marsarchaeota G1 archaeon BE_D TaxID=1978156 RepID=A0A2R6AE91_9ARCH|nr:MAG: hypothetical protein B9Q02_09295 [Candidatus Marsarchaeota G1 archaeon BE_D]